MAIFLKNLVFIHVPKTGGRWVSDVLNTCVSGARVYGDPVYDAHKSPDADGYVPFYFSRHPASWLHSLFHHRARKKNNTRGGAFNWQPYLKLERECGDEDYDVFLNKVVNHQGVVLDYFDYYVAKYDNTLFGKFENLSEDLIEILEANDEDFDPNMIRRKSREVIGANNHMTKRPVLLDEAVNSRFLSALFHSEKYFYQRYGYSLRESSS